MTDSFTYYRLLNLGNYENKRLEGHRVVKEGEDPRTVARELMLEVEQSIREDVEKEIVQKIENLKSQERELREEVIRLKTEVEQLKTEKAQLSNPNPIEVNTTTNETTETDF